MLSIPMPSYSSFPSFPRNSNSHQVISFLQVLLIIFLFLTIFFCIAKFQSKDSAHSIFYETTTTVSFFNESTNSVIKEFTELSETNITAATMYPAKTTTHQPTTSADLEQLRYKFSKVHFPL
ncbi:uncharacterized protein CELE_T09F5.20 [Caenorhabditis elegans]|uniref:Transmembrane protein n=2 Tax=Caenorhabditis elegans TaxID=6239 RepID=G3MU75_CAEEL|nr:Transmembrane protein [Caenorhabditis elegans]CCD31116.1 Transmembrane protein [Caenorhabditis elegans]|eukprot:NP_001256651.1 Uncharacterized protein CELE_T09F5.20 [Caenorhabditis elegans]